MDIQVTKVGVVSCSGEEIAGGTVCRSACRKVLDQLRPDSTVTICLPLFVAGGIEERTFASRFPTITLDGCEKQCAARATEKLSGKPSRSLVVPEILGRHGISTPTHVRGFGPDEEPAVRAVALELAAAVDQVLDDE